MTVTIFDPLKDLIIVPAYVPSANGHERELRLVLDTGAAPTIIASDILDELGYSAREHGDQLASTRSIAGREHGYMLRVKNPTEEVVEFFRVADSNIASIPTVTTRLSSRLS